MEPPGYGRRDVANIRREPAQLVMRARQTIADARRARDAISVLPGVTGQRIFLAGISLGGFTAPLVASLDDGFDGLFILLAGGDLYSVLANGNRDAARFRQRLNEAGYHDESVREMLSQIEPLRIANRLSPPRTWIISGIFDTVVPPDSSERMSRAIGLSANHHIRMPLGHYTAVLALPVVAKFITMRMAEGGSS